MRRDSVFANPKLPILLLIALTPSLSAQVLNMSHDLVGLGIANQNMTPNSPSVDSRPLFQAALNYAQNHPVQTLTADSGSYYLLSNTQSNAVLILINLSNLTIDLAGSTVYFAGPQVPNGIQLFYCSNVTLTNFNLDYLSPPFTQVQLKSVDTVNRIVKYQTIAGWPDPSTFNNFTTPFGAAAPTWAAFFRNGVIVPGTTRTLLKSPFTNGSLPIQDQLPSSQASVLSTLQPGDTVVVTIRGGGPEILAWEGTGITLSNISIFASSEEAVDMFQVSNSTIENVNVMPRPNSSNLIAAAGDGIHFRNLLQNNLIHHCYVTRTMDDGLVFDSTFAATVVSQPGPQQLIVTRNGSVRFANQTLMNFVDPTSTVEFTGATIDFPKSC